LEAQCEHAAESHGHNFLSIPQSAALEQMVSTNPMVSATSVRRGLDLHPDPAAKSYHSNQRRVAREVAAARLRALEPIFQGGKLDGEQGSLKRLSEKIYLKTLVDEHNRAGKHLQLHDPVYIGHQFKDGIIFGCYSTPMLLLHPSRGINSGWLLLAGFDSTFGIMIRSKN
jgi:hypothetical protein